MTENLPLATAGYNRSQLLDAEHQLSDFIVRCMVNTKSRSCSREANDFVYRVLQGCRVLECVRKPKKLIFVIRHVTNLEH